MSTSAKSVRHSKPIDRPFEPKILKRAQEMSSRYQVVLQFEDGEYFGRCLEMPLIMGDGKTADACVENVRQALAATLAYMLEEGQTPPSPAAEQTRNQQVNIRLTGAEREILEQTAHRKGFRGISDYMRHAALVAYSE
jgi:predicted RNase H-like HicB family nuclease